MGAVDKVSKLTTKAEAGGMLDQSQRLTVHAATTFGTATVTRRTTSIHSRSELRSRDRAQTASADHVEQALRCRVTGEAMADGTLVLSRPVPTVCLRSRTTTDPGRRVCSEAGSEAAELRNDATRDSSRSGEGRPSRRTTRAKAGGTQAWCDK